MAEIKKEYPNTSEKQEAGYLENQVLTYNNLIIDAKEEFLRDKDNFAGKIYQYCYNDTKDEKYKEYGQKLAEYDQFRFKAIEIEKQYLAQSPEYHLKKLNQSRNA